MAFQPKTIIEPFKVKTVEALAPMSREARECALKRAHGNLFHLESHEVLIDLLTDSGTSAMSDEQWAAIMRGDEAYAGSRSFRELESVVRHLTGYPHIIPTHQGRAAERILFQVLASRYQGKKTGKIISNSFFDTTRANLEAAGFEGHDFPCEEFHDMDSDFHFKGNIDLKKAEAFLEKTPPEERVMAMMTVTNNSCGGQPVSLKNLEAAAALFKRYHTPFFLDACRFAENAAFIQKFEKPEMSAEQIAQKVFSLGEGCTFSAKKDALVNIGGFLATKTDELVEDFTTLLILTEGFPTYGGLAGRDLAAMAQGLKEILEPGYLDYRLAVTRYMGLSLQEKGIPFLKPAGGHAIYLDAKRFCSHLKPSQYPGQALAMHLYLEAGIRSCEIGSVMFGRRADGTEAAHTSELVRLAIPRRVYTQSHMDYVLEAIAYVYEHRQKMGAVRIVKEPKRLRHFSAHFDW